MAKREFSQTPFAFVFEIEDQRDWQRRPGCHNIPYSCYFCHLLRVFGVKKVLDLTYGVGSLYSACKRELYVIAVDIKRWDWVVAPDEFHISDALDFVKSFDGRVDAAVVDPPFPTDPTQYTRDKPWLHHGRFPLSKIVQVVKTSRSKAAYVLLKYMPADMQEETELLKLGPRYVLTWRYIRSHVLAHGNTSVVRNASKIYVY